MKTTVLIILTAIVFSNISAQINMADSTVKVIGYWRITDMQSFDITYDKYKVEREFTGKELPQ